MVQPETEKLSPGLPIAKLQTIDLGQLQSGSREEAQRLLESSRESGIFYLDLQSIQPQITPIVDSVFELSEKLFDLPLEEKSIYDVDKLCKLKCNGYVAHDPFPFPKPTLIWFINSTRYKPVGRNFGGLVGERDGFETYVVRVPSPQKHRSMAESILPRFPKTDYWAWMANKALHGLSRLTCIWRHYEDLLPSSTLLLRRLLGACHTLFCFRRPRT